MKPAAVAGIVAVVFVAGVGVGLLFSERKEAQPQVASGSSVKRPEATRAPVDAPPPPVDVSTGGPGATGPGSSGPPSGPSGGPGGPGVNPHKGPGALPPAPPPPLSSDAQKEADRIRREQEARKGRGGGRVTTLVQKGTPEEQEKRNTERMASWERRLRYGNDIRIKGLRESVGLTAAQEEQLRAILDEELAARMSLVDEHRLKKISDTTFDEKAKANMQDAQKKLQALLSPEQYAKYVTLKPREQVLRDDVK